ncbi:hypothetical protein BEH_11555 [Priestia filamentosa]|jgi:transcriptional regulator with XRE-family HTH domain|uniref:HTH cro/C1-type domain-containing protein n=1 Tax=Priestia filamentosa TaxID=1402861 RepID=A0A0H4KF03_9BACI|nr:helix-turn-helix transcriptional regulator [Priestia filamentosa]AKO92672.1 hypothetical protein BEH_11555 [Priestia filamentosa]
MTVGERIIKLREKKNWNQRELARRAGLNYSVMNRIETGKRPTTDQELKIFADLFNVSTDFLLGRENSPKDNPDVQGIWFYDMDDISEEEFQEIEEELNEYKEYLLAKKRKKK